MKLAWATGTYYITGSRELPSHSHHDKYQRKRAAANMRSRSKRHSGVCSPQALPNRDWLLRAFPSGGRHLELQLQLAAPPAWPTAAHHKPVCSLCVLNHVNVYDLKARERGSSDCFSRGPGSRLPLPGGLHSSLFPSLQPENVNIDVPVQPFSLPILSASVEGFKL